MSAKVRGYEISGMKEREHSYKGVEIEEQRYKVRGVIRPGYGGAGSRVRRYEARLTKLYIWEKRKTDTNWKT